MLAPAFVLPAVLAAWLFTSAAIAHGLTQLFFDNGLRKEMRAVVFIALVPLILFDEMLGRAQFEELCRERAVIRIEAAQVEGRTVVHSDQPPESLTGVFVPITAHRSVYADARTGQAVLSYEILRARGGRLARAIGADGREQGPLTFQGSCEPANRGAVLGALRLRVVPREMAIESTRDAASASG